MTAVESAVTGLPPYTTRSGFKDASVSLTASFRSTNLIKLSAPGIVTTLLRAVKDSPQADKKTQPAGIFAVSYRL